MTFNSEHMLLSCIMLDPDILDEVQVSDKHFEDPVNATLFRAMQYILRRDKVLSVVTVKREMDKHYKGKIDAVTLMEVLDCSESAASWRAYNKEILESYKIREIEKVIGSAKFDLEQMETSEKIITDIQTATDNLQCEGLSANWVGASTLVSEGIESIISKHNGNYEGIAPYISDWKSLIGGFEPGSMNILCARSGVGKTTLAINLAVRWAEEGKRVAFYSLEMGRPVIGELLACILTGVDRKEAREGRLTDLKKLESFSAPELPLKIEFTTRLTATKLRAFTRKIKREFNPDIIMLDLLQNMDTDSNGMSEYEKVTNNSNEFRDLMKELGLIGVAVVQLRRDAEGNEPQLSHLKSSGSLEQDAATVTGIYHATDEDGDERFEHINGRPDYSKPIMILKVMKNRFGPVGRCPVVFNKSQGWFEEYIEFAESKTSSFEFDTEEKDVEQELF